MTQRFSFRSAVLIAATLALFTRAAPATARADDSAALMQTETINAPSPCGPPPALRRAPRAWSVCDGELLMR